LHALRYIFLEPLVGRGWQEAANRRIQNSMTGTVRMTFPDGSTEDVPSEVGVAIWSDAEEHLPENISDKSLEVVLIELKD
jgi:hypothetical protein